MHMPNISDDANEESIHLRAIRALAAEFGQPVGEVAEVYESEVARLELNAKVADFVALFAARRTRDRLTSGAR
jgi:hypothetical protein